MGKTGLALHVDLLLGAVGKVAGCADGKMLNCVSILSTRRTPMRRWLKILYNIILYCLALIGLAVVVFGIFFYSPTHSTTDALAVTTQPKQIILVPTSTPEPTKTLAPTSTPRPTIVPTATDLPDYPTSLMSAVGDLSPSMIAVTEMLDHPNYGNKEWTDSIYKELDLIDGVYDKVVALVPPDNFKSAHAMFISAVSRCRDSSRHYRLAVDNVNQPELNTGTALLNSCAEQVKLAGNLFKRAQQ